MSFDKFDNKKAELELYKDMRTLITELKKADSKSNFNRLAVELNNLYTLANYFDLYDYPEVEDYVARSISVLDSDNRFKIFLKNHRRLYDLINEDLDYHLAISELSDLFIEQDFEKSYHELEYMGDYQEMLYYAKEFMNKFDSKLLNAYNEIEKKNHILIKGFDETGLGGLFTPLSNNKTPYLSFFLNNNIDDSSTIVHETGHLRQYDLLKNNKTNDNYNYLFQEVYSFFLQFAFYHYIKEKKIYVKDIEACFNACLDNLSKYLIDLNDDLTTNELSNTYLFNDIQYCYGILVGLKYFDIYKNDPEYAKLLTDSFIEQSYHYKPMKVLNSFGLDSEELVSGEILKKYIKK